MALYLSYVAEAYERCVMLTYTEDTETDGLVLACKEMKWEGQMGCAMDCANVVNMMNKFGNMVGLTATSHNMP